jgi:hypothetical protein
LRADPRFQCTEGSEDVFERRRRLEEHLGHGVVVLLQFSETGRVGDEAEAAGDGEVVVGGGGAEIDGLVLDDAFAEFGVGKGAVGDRAGGNAGEIVVVPGLANRHGFVRGAVALSVEQGRLFPEGALGGEDFDGSPAELRLVECLAEVGENGVGSFRPVVRAGTEFNPDGRLDIGQRGGAGLREGKEDGLGILRIEVEGPVAVVSKETFELCIKGGEQGLADAFGAGRLQLFDPLALLFIRRCCLGIVIGIAEAELVAVEGEIDVLREALDQPEDFRGGSAALEDEMFADVGERESGVEGAADPVILFEDRGREIAATGDFVDQFGLLGPGPGKVGSSVIVAGDLAEVGSHPCRDGRKVLKELLAGRDGQVGSDAAQVLWGDLVLVDIPESLGDESTGAAGEPEQAAGIAAEVDLELA